MYFCCKQIQVKLQKLKNIDYNVPLILGGGVNGIGLARSFGEKNIKSIILDTAKNFSFYSKYVTGIICPHPREEKEFINFLIEFGKDFKNKPLIFVTNDHWMIPVSKNQNLLIKYYEFSMSDWKVIENATDKRYMYKIAEEIGIDIPQTFYLESITKIDEISNNITYPCILKPVVTVNFAEKLGAPQRVFTLNNKEELQNLSKKILISGLDDREIIIQEYIPGDISDLYTITTYSNKNADIVCYSTGHKLRQRPPVAGTIISGRVIPEPRLYEPAKKLIKKLNFFGIANTEFKYDHRDNKYKLMEINPRPGKWNYSVTASGINMPYLLWQEIRNENSETKLYSDKELIWICLFEDFFNTVLGGFRKKGFPEYSLSLWEYFKSVKGKKVDAIISLSDPLPAIFYLFNH